MSDKKKLLLIFSILFVLFGVLTASRYLKDFFYRNPEGTEGNTAGNLNNGGLFVQAGDKVYFANGYDDGKLYVMNADETELKKLSDIKPQYLNADERYIYYYLNDAQTPAGLGGFTVQLLGVYRMDHKGKHTESLDRILCRMVKLVDNTVFYVPYDDKKQMSLCGINVRTKEKEKLLEFEVNPACAYNGSIYYNGMEEDHFLYRYNPALKSQETLYEGNVWNPDMQGDYVYFMNVGDDYKLCRYELSGGKEETLTQDRVDSYLVCGNYIIYQKNSQTAPALMIMNTDGSNPQLLAEGNYTGLSATSEFAYFTEFGKPAPMYKVSLKGGSFGILTFDAAKEAALAQTK